MKQILIILFTLSFFQNEEPQGLKPGDNAPLFESKAYGGDSIKLSSLIKKGPVVLFFYRGAWCSYCNRQMSELQDSIKYIYDKGASVIAVTPELDTSISKTVAKTKAGFPIIHDKGYKIMDAYKVSFKLDESTVKKYKLWGINIEKANGNEENILPVPATYIIDRSGKIKYVYFNKNYKQRASVAEILKHL